MNETIILLSQYKLPHDSVLIRSYKAMEAVTTSSKHYVVIPREVRK